MPGNPQPSAASTWLDAFFESYYRHRPVNATFIGRHHLDHVLPDFSESGLGDARADAEDLLRHAPDPDAPELLWHESVDVRLARGFLRCQLWELGSPHFHRENPSTYVGEAVFGVMSLLLTPSAPLEDRLQSAIGRLQGIPELLSQARANVRAAPAAWTERARRECRGTLAFLTEGLRHVASSGSTYRGLLDVERGGPTRGESQVSSLVGAGEQGREGRDPKPIRTRLRRAADRAAAAVESFDRVLAALPVSPRHSCGAEAFTLYLTEGHLLDTDADELSRYAREQLAEAGARLDEATATHEAPSPAELLARLAELHPSPSEYYASYRDTWDAMRRLAEANRLVSWPDAPIRYVPRPAWARAAAPDLYFLFYRSPPAFDRPAIHDYLVTPIDGLPEADRNAMLRAHNDSVIKLNHVIHHGGIGHHVQNWHAFRAESRVGRVAAVDCASRTAMFCAGTMAEGWACYATDLMSEHGALTPLEQVAEHQARARICARAIVDIELHHGRMSLEQAETFYQRHAGMSATAARSEAVKNSMFPAAALMYLAGTDAIHDLRRDLGRTAGDAFDLRAFHDEFLSYGSIPVPLIARLMKDRHAVA